MKEDTMILVEQSKVLNTPGAEKKYKRELFHAVRQELEKKAYAQEGWAHADDLLEFMQDANANKWHAAAANEKETQATAGHSHSLPSKGNEDQPLMDDEAAVVAVGLRAEANAQEAARTTKCEKPWVEPIFYADTAAAQIPVDENADVEPIAVYDRENPRITVNEYFPTMKEFRMALRQHGIKKGFKVHKVKTDKTRYRGECKAEGCPWRIVAHKLQNQPTVVITMIPEEHNCISNSKLVSSMASQQWVAEKVVGWLRNNPSLGAKELQEKLHEVYNVEVVYATVWAGRQKAMHKIFESWEDSFQTLYNFRAELLSRSPGSTMEIFTTIRGDNVHFDKLFIAFEPCIDGFKNGCRPYLWIDSTALNGVYSGQLACACALDGHNWIYPVAWAIFDSESNDNWTWFMTQLKKVIGNPPGLAISTDGCKGYGHDNLAESFSESVININDMPLFDLVDRLRQMIMVLWYKRRNIGNKFSGIILPAIIDQLNEKTRRLGNMKVCKGGLQSGEVSGNFQGITPWRHVVNLNEHTCSCGEWQLTGKPCLHALALISIEINVDMESFVHDYYSVARFRAAYKGIIPPMTDKSQWPRVDTGFKLLPQRGAGSRKYISKVSNEPDATKQHQCKQCGEKCCTLHGPKKRKRCQAEEDIEAEDTASTDDSLSPLTFTEGA